MKNHLTKVNHKLFFFFSYLTMAFLMAVVGLTSIATLSAVADKADGVLATVNDRKITVQDFLDFYKSRPRIARWNSAEKDQKNPREILDALIGKVLMAQDAYTLYPDALKRYEREVANFEQRCLINAFSEKEIDQGIKISEQEIAGRIPENRKIEVHLRRIVVATRKEADRLKKQLENGADFASLAKKFSLAGEAEKGGDIGYMTFDQGIFPKKVVEEIFQLKKGEVGNPGKIREGFALFQEIGKRKVDAATLDRSKQFIRQQITLERKRERWDQLLEQLKKESFVAINNALFREIEQAIARRQGRAALERMKDLEIAKVKSRSVRLGEIAPANLNISLGEARPWEKDVTLLRRILERHIKVLLVSDYARQLHYDQSPEVKKNISRFKDDLMVKQLITEKVYKGLTIKTEEGRRYYQKHLSEYRTPEQVRIDQIVVQDEVTAATLLHQLKQGTDFTELSQKYSSSDALRLKGFFAKGESGMGAEFESKVFNLQIGEMSSLIKTSKGFYIVKLLEKQKEGGAEFAEVESGIREKLLSAKKEKALSDYIASLRQKSRLIVNEPLFQEIVNNAL